MKQFTNCPKCNSENVYFDGSLWNCPDCGESWSGFELSTSDSTESDPSKISDAFGNLLSDGDSVTLIKDLRIKGSSSSIKVGTKVKGIRLIDSSDGHNIACKIDGFGAMNLKSEFVKKS